MTLTPCSVPSDPFIAAFPRTIKVQCATIPLPSQTAKLEKVPLSREPLYRGAEKSSARLGRKQATATEDFEFHISYL
jgi:hypothetical protein